MGPDWPRQPHGGPTMGKTTTKLEPQPKRGLARPRTR